jgi:hypothetical protein
MGSHGISGIEEILLDLTQKKIVRLSEVPVWLLKETTDFKGEHFVSSDFSEEIKNLSKMLNLYKFLMQNCL